MKVALPRRLVKVYVAMFICFFSNCFSVTILFPFVPFMVEFLLPWLTEEEELVATYVGVLVSALCFGRLFGSYVWGAIADRKGRKPVILISLSLIGLLTAIFGFSVSFEMAVILRFLAGVFNGVVGTCKAVVSEASDDSNQAFGITVIGTAWGLGIILGPAIAGVISDPIGQYNLTIENAVTREFLTRFPYSPPCLLSAFLCAVSVLVSLFILPETLGTKRNQEHAKMTTSHSQSTTKGLGIDPPHDQPSPATDADDVLDTKGSTQAGNDLNDRRPETQDGQRDTDSMKDENGIERCRDTDSMKNENGIERCRDTDSMKDENGIERCNTLEAVDEETAHLLTNDGDNEDDDVEVIVARKRARLSAYVLKVLCGIRDVMKNLFTLLRDKSTLLSLLVYSIFSSIDIGFNDIYSVWAKTSPHLGGLGFRLNEIGITLTIASVFVIPINLVFFPLMERKFGLLRVYYLQAVILIPTLMLLPNIHYLYEVKWLLWILVCSMLLIIQVSFTIGFNCQNIFINNSVTSDKLGAVNGVGTTLGSFIRAIVSLVSGQIFSISLLATTAGLGYPLDYRLLFLVFGIAILICVFLTACLPVSINKQKVVEDVDLDRKQ